MSKYFSKFLIALLVASFFLAPVSVVLRPDNGNQVVHIQENRVLAEVTGVTATLDDASMEAGKVTPFATISGTLVGGEPATWKLYQQPGVSPIAEGNFPSVTVDTPIGIPINYAFVEGQQYYVNFLVSTKSATVNFTYSTSGAPTNITGTGSAPPGKKIGEEYDYSCISFTSFSLSGCIAAFLQIVWAYIAAPIMELGGRFLDFFVYYSTDSASYTGSFVEKGWAVVRDVANLLFIIALLYVAFKIILNDTHSNPKKLIGMIIMMALVINFSLFFTRVVIDASNILANIFYNNINSIDSNGHPIQNGEGEKSISVGMVAKFNPQQVVSQATYDKDDGKAIYILTTIVLIAISLYAAYIFFSVALLFVARVVSLWLAMIFSPIAFASNTVSFDFGGLGWKKWLSGLIGNAMLAPLFVFFLYMIVLFLNVTNFVSYSGTSTTMQKIMGVIIPFIVLAGLLQRAKKMAVESSGEMGKMITSAGQKIGGFALGAATGGAAYLGTQTLGRGASSYLANNKERLQERMAKGGLDGWWAKTQLKTLDYGSKATFDGRQTKLGNQMVKISGMDFQAPKVIGLGSKADGYKGVVERTAAETEKEKELYKTTMSNDKVKAWSEERILKYQEGLAQATKDKTGDAKEQAKAAFIRLNGDAPISITTAEQLNKVRLQAFKENLGKSDLVGSLATSIVRAQGRSITRENFEDSSDYRKKYEESEYDKAFKKERLEKAKRGEVFDREAFNSTYKKPTQIGFDEKIAKEVTNDRISKTKMRIGAVASLAGGAVMGNPFGVIGMGAGAIAGGLRAADQGMIEGAADKKVAANIDKELKKYEGVDKRIEEMEKVLTSYDKTKEEGQKSTDVNVRETITLPDGSTRDNVGIFVQIEEKDAAGNIIYKDSNTVDKNRVISVIAKKETEARTLNVRHDAAVRTLVGITGDDIFADSARKNAQDEITAIEKDLRVNKEATQKLEELKGIEEKILAAKTKRDDLKDNKHEQQHKDEHKSGGGGKTNVESPKHEPHAQPADNNAPASDGHAPPAH